MTWAFASQIFNLVMLLITEYLADKKRAREATEASEKAQKGFDEIASIAFEKMRKANAEARRQDQDFQDRLDEENKPKP